MELVFTFIRETRKAIIRLADTLSIDELNSIPEGYNNNIIWNIGHIYVATQGLCYLRTGVQKDRQITHARKYTKGSKPEAYVEASEISFVKEQLLSSIDVLEQDYKKGFFKSVTPFATDTYGKMMHSIEEVITCTLAHDNYHFGCIKSLQKVINAVPVIVPPHNQQQ